MVNPDDELLTPREVAELFGVRTTTIARWAREGRLDPFRTPGGHRRYRRASVRALIAAEDASAADSADETKMAEDAARLYEQGWSIRQVAAQPRRKWRRMSQAPGGRCRDARLATARSVRAADLPSTWS
ncbi:helix-turn-helix domain-containing protein [Actinoallomurus oryzae]